MISKRLLITLSLLGSVVFMLSGCAGNPEPKETAESIDFTNFGYNPNWQTQMQSCLREDGWEVDITADGAIGITLSPGQSDAYEAAKQKCIDIYDYQGEKRKFTDAELRLLYLMNKKTYECLVEQGYTEAKLPSEQSFIDLYYEEGGWSDPYRELWHPGGSITEEEYANLQKICPPPEMQNQ